MASSLSGGETTWLLRKILWKKGMMVHGEDIGGMDARTVRLRGGLRTVLGAVGPESADREMPGREPRKAGADESPRSDRG